MKTAKLNLLFTRAQFIFLLMHWIGIYTVRNAWIDSLYNKFVYI